MPIYRFLLLKPNGFTLVIDAIKSESESKALDVFWEQHSSFLNKVHKIESKDDPRLECEEIHVG